jgi:molybdate transport system substrate-binding protein
MRLRHVFLLICTVEAPTALADELQVVSVGTVGPAIRQIVPIFEETTGHTVRVIFGNPGATVRNLREYPSADVGLAPQAAWKDAIETGAFDESGRVLIAKTKIGVGIRQGAEAFNISEIEGAKNAMSKATSICVGDPQAGSPATAALFRALEVIHMADNVRGKAKMFATGEAIGHAVVNGECEMGVTTLSELKSVPGIHVLGALPSQLIEFAPVTYAVLLKGSRRPKLAKEFISFLSSDPAKKMFQAAGLDPNQ